MKLSEGWNLRAFAKSGRDTGPNLGYKLHRHDPLRQGLWYVVLVVMAAVCSYFAYRTGLQHGLTQSPAQALAGAQELARPPSDDLAELKAENSSQRAEIERLRRTSELDQKAAAEVSRSLSEMEAKLLELNEELSFYKTVVGPSKLDPGLHVQDFRISSAGSDREYSFRLILTQTRGDTRTSSGAVDIVVEGRQGVKALAFPLKELASSGSGEVIFSFRFYQSVTGDFLLPVGFKPTGVRLKVRSSDDGFKGSERAYRWSDIVTGGA